MHLVNQRVLNVFFLRNLYLRMEFYGVVKLFSMAQKDFFTCVYLFNFISETIAGSGYKANSATAIDCGGWHVSSRRRHLALGEE